MINLQNSSQTLFESKNPLFPSIPFKFGEDSHFEPYFSIFGWNHQLLDDRIFGASILRSSGRGGSRHGLESATTSAGAERDELGSWGGPETTVKISGWVVPVFVGCLEFDTTEAGVKFGWLSLGTPKIEWEWQSALFFEFCELLQMRLFKDLRFSDYTKWCLHMYGQFDDIDYTCPRWWRRATSGHILHKDLIQIWKKQMICWKGHTSVPNAVWFSFLLPPFAVTAVKRVLHICFFSRLGAWCGLVIHFASSILKWNHLFNSISWHMGYNSWLLDDDQLGPAPSLRW